MGYTKEQLEAINQENTNIIVSAGAGSGKTAVLTERVIRKLKDGIDIDKLLILTFTNEAANEMKNRIRKEIIKNSLNNQLSLLDSAYITTFDSYALSLVRKYHYILNISNNVSIIDNSIIQINKYMAIDKIFENMYGNQNFNKVIEDYCSKDDTMFKKEVINISNKLDLLIDKNSYLNNYLDTHYNQTYLENILNDYLGLIKNKINNIDCLLENMYKHIDSDLIAKIDIVLQPLLNSTSYEEYKNNINFKLPQFRNTNEYAKKIKENLKEEIDSLKKLLKYNNTSEIISSITNTKDYVQVIIEIIKKLDEEINNYKIINDTYEFNDIAHMAVNLVKENANIKEEIKNYYNEIMIDEYQDTSDIQEEFIQLISNNNVYMVGDIKQSIYRFRNANPNIFENKYNAYSKNNGGMKIDLLKNFRSREETLQGINAIFNLVMDKYLGNAAYIEEHNMIFGNTNYLNENTNSNNYLEVYNYAKNDQFSNEEIEMFIVSDDINKKIKEHYQVLDKTTNKLRNVEYQDICIITDRNKYLDLYKKILEYHEIPSVLYKDEDLVKEQDILVIKNLINLVNQVNNNCFDQQFNYNFVSIARSYLFNYSDNTIYDIVTNNSYKNDQIFKKCLNISINQPLIKIVNQILNEFNVFECLTTLNNIDKCLIRINYIQELAINLTNLDYDITDFINYIDNTIKHDFEIKYNINTKGTSAVKIMNIHKSKGLEFSLCYFVGMGNKFTIKDLSNKFIMDNTYGIIVPYKDEEIKESVLIDLFKEQFIHNEISEKIRLFYVALTRCREKMIILANLNDEEKYQSLVPNYIRINYRSFLDILNSINIISKYKVDKSSNYNKKYNNIKEKDILKYINNTKEVIKQKINIDTCIIQQNHYSKQTHKLLDNNTIKHLEEGTKIHEILEREDFYNSKNKYVLNLIEKVEPNFINVCKEYEFVYQKDNNDYHGIIDLILEYEDNIKIIDYKLMNIEDEKYIEQLNGYKEYISTITNKKVYIYLYSIINNELKELV